MLVVTEPLGAAAGSRAPGAVKRQRGQLLLEPTCCWCRARAAAPPGARSRGTFSLHEHSPKASCLPPLSLPAGRAQGLMGNITQ